MNESKQMPQVQMLPIDAVELNTGQLEGLPANPREIRDEKFLLLKENIQKHPELLEYRSLMVYPMTNGKHIIIGGNMRYRAMAELGYKEVPCVILPQETTTEKLASYTILDNNGFGKWDWDLLANGWSDFDLEGWGLDMEGFDVNPNEYGEDFDLPSGEKKPFQQISFTLADAQAEMIKEAINNIKQSEEYKYTETFGNANTNGNALYLIISQWAEQNK